MGSHSDDDHKLRKTMTRFIEEIPKESIADKLASLERRGEEMTLRRENEITAGKIGEEVLLEVQAKNLLVRRLPDDPDGVLRISLGSLGERGYLIFRGDPSEIDLLLARAVKALRKVLTASAGGIRSCGR
jgi:hypothetical protein